MTNGDVKGLRSGASDRRSAGHKIDHEDDERNDQEQVNQAAGDVEAEAEEPQDQQHSKNCPKHEHRLSGTRIGWLVFIVSCPA